MNLNWLIPGFLITFIGSGERYTLSISWSNSSTTNYTSHSDRTPKSLFSPQPASSRRSSLSSWVPPSRPSLLPKLHHLDYTIALLRMSSISDANFVISPLATKLSLLALAILGDDTQLKAITKFLKIHRTDSNEAEVSRSEILQQANWLLFYGTEFVDNSSQNQFYYSQIQTFLFTLNTAFYYDFNLTLAQTLLNSSLIEGFYPINGTPSVGDESRFELFKRTHLTDLQANQFHLPTQNQLTSFTAISQKWPLTFYRRGPLRFYLNSTAFTQPEALHRVLHKCSYLHLHNATFLKIPFENVKFSLILGLPDVTSNLTHLLTSLAAPLALEKTLKWLDYRQLSVNLTLPQFRIDSALNITTNIFERPQVTSKLSTFNLNRLFPITVPLPIITQRAAINVNEFGTSFEMFEPSFEAIYIQPEVEVLINRPFLFLIVKQMNGMMVDEIVLAGKVSDP